MKKTILFVILFYTISYSFSQISETEPNNTIDASGVITITEDGTFNGSYNQYDVEYFKIKSYAGGNVTFNWISAPAGNGLSIYEDDSNYGSTYLTRVLNPGQITVTLNPNKYYTIRTHTGFATGSWSFSVSGLKFPPDISTSTATAITKTSTIIGGNITSDNGNAVTERGIVYSNSDSTPKIGETGVTKDDEGGIGTGVFSETINGLTEETTYYYRAYAINSNGTGYGDIKSFTTLGVSITAIERENPTSENLYENSVTYKVTFSKPVKDVDVSDFTTSSSGATISNVNQISTTVYEVTVNNITTNGDVFLQIKGINGVAGSNNITTLAVAGTINTIVNQTQDDDWLNQSYIGQSFTATSSNFLSKAIFFPKEPEHTFSGTAMLRFYIGEQLNPDLNAADYSQEVNISDSGNQEFVLSTPQNLTNGQKYTILLSDFNGSGSQAFIGSLNGDYSQGRAVFIGHNNNYPNYDLKIKIEEETVSFIGDMTLSTTAPTTNEKYIKLTPPALPVVETTNATNVASTSATLAGNVTHQGQSAVTERGVLYSSTDTNPKIGDADVTKDENGSGTGVFSKNITGLTTNTIYYYRAYAINTQGTSYGDVKTFSLNNALNFDGVDDRITITDNAAFDFSSGFTAEAWINPDVLSTQTYLSKYGDNSQETFAFILKSSGRIEFTITTNGSTDQYFESSFTIAAGEWSHVALTFDGTIMKAYINGTAAGTKNVSGTMFDSTAPIEIGARDNNYFFNGSIDEVRIWTRTLTATEINNQKDVSLPSNTNGLVAYYQFNQGIAEGDNSVINTLTDSSTNNLTGTLINFSKTGATSNFVAGVTGNFSNTTIATNTFSITGNWSTLENWSLGVVPSQVDKAVIEDGKTVIIDVDDLIINDFELENGAVLFIPTDKEITIQNSFTSNGTLELQSDKTNSGVLFVEGTVSGNVTYKRGGLLANKWSIVTPPVSGQTVRSFAENADNNIRVNTTPDPDRYAIAYYDDSQASGSKWRYYDAGVNASTEFIAGQSYSMSRATDGQVSFTGTLTVENLQKTLIAGQWNAIGNPFTTYYPANKNSNNSFLNDNMEVLDETYPSLYLWDNDQEKYVAVTNIDETARSLPPGQGFFIKMKEGETKILFNQNKRSSKPNDGDTDFAKTNNATPSVTLNLSNGENTVKTAIKYFENATVGFDKGYDIGNFNGSGLDIYTRLVNQENTTNFTIQSLPLNSYESAIIPIGLNGNNGDRITFTISSVNIPNSINIYLEDKEKNTYQKLSETNGNYTIVLKDKVSGVGRFYLHTNSKSLGTKQISTLEGMSIFNTNKILKINGLKNATANIKLYSILGKEVFSKNFTANKENEILLPKISKGVYFVELITVEGKLNKKIIID